MASSSELWTGGSRTWWISREGINGPKGFEFSGAVPKNFHRIKSEMEAKQKQAGGEAAEVDYLFEIPLLVAKSLTGFSMTRFAPMYLGMNLGS